MRSSSSWIASALSASRAGVFLGAGFAAASAAFFTPVSSPVNTLVLAPGGYRFNDFVRVGLPLLLLTMALTLLVTPLLLPL